jgi:hypothetical protein
MTANDHVARREARRVLARGLRQLASGRITNDEFEDSAPSWHGDRAIRELFWFAWGFYDSLYEHRLRGRHRLSPHQRQVFARCVLFLRSDLEYEWPQRSRWLWRPQLNGRLLTPWWKPDSSVLEGLPFCRGLARAARRREECAMERRKRSGRIVDDRIWPFRTRADLRRALSTPVYLAGQSSE